MDDVLYFRGISIDTIICVGSVSQEDKVNFEGSNTENIDFNGNNEERVYFRGSVL